MPGKNASPVTAEQVTIPAAAGGAVAGILSTPSEHPPAAAVGIHSATAVAQRLYTGFAEYLCENGVAVLTYDYCGIGASGSPKLNRNLRMRDWMEQDVPAAGDWWRTGIRSFRSSPSGTRSAARPWFSVTEPMIWQGSLLWGRTAESPVPSRCGGMLAAVEHCIRVVKAAGKPVGVNAFAEATARRYDEAGVDFILVGADVALLPRGSEALAAKYNSSTDDDVRASYRQMSFSCSRGLG